MIQGEDFQKSLVFTRSIKNKCKEPSIKQRGDLTILPSFIIRLLICCNFLYNQIKNLHAFNFSEETRDGDSAGDYFSTDEQVVGKVTSVSCEK